LQYIIRPTITVKIVNAITVATYNTIQLTVAVQLLLQYNYYYNYYFL